MGLIERVRRQTRAVAWRFRRTRKLQRETRDDLRRYKRTHSRAELREFRKDRRRFRRSRDLLHRSQHTLTDLRKRLNASGRGRAMSLLRRCTVIAAAHGRYIWGGGHDRALRFVHARPGLDCSSSVSLALWRTGLFPWPNAIVSGEFWKWGAPGRGRFFTIHYNSEHVWIEFHGLLRWVRFDTSPQGGTEGRGPRLRFGRRFTAGFKQRHWPGL